MKKINRWLIFLLCVPTVAFAQQNSLLQKYRSMALEEFYKLKYCSTVVYMVPRA